MTFTAPHAPPSSDNQSTETVNNDPFFPEIKLAEFQIDMRVDSVATSARAKSALYNAVIEVNFRLRKWLAAQLAEGLTRIDEITEPRGLPTGATKARYLRAVYSLAKAELNEQLNGYSLQADKSDEFENADILRRNAAWLINDIAGKPRATIELI